MNRLNIAVSDTLTPRAGISKPGNATPPLENLRQRQSKLREQLAAQHCDGLLVFSEQNIRYLTGYTGEAATVLVTPVAVRLITDYRFTEEARESCKATRIYERDRDQETLASCVKRWAKEDGCRALGFEPEKVSVAQWAPIERALSHCTLKPIQGLIEALRKIKDDWELVQLGLAAQIADLSLAQCLPLLKPGITEAQFALELEYTMQKNGSTGISFPTIAAFGTNTSRPHAIPGRKTLREGDLITVDFGAVVNGYRSDMTRSYVLGNASTKQQRLFDTVCAAQSAALSVLCRGTTGAQASDAAHAILRQSEFAPFAGPGLGHGLGLFLHEQPWLGPHCDETLQTGYVVTVEPGIYIPDWGGLRIEDDVRITDTGFERITHAPTLFELIG